VLGALAGIFGATTVVFLILYWLPGDPAMLVAGDDASPAMVANIQAKLGTNAPLWHQYITYIWNLAHGDMGTSFTTNEPVAHRLAGQVFSSLQLTFCACLFAILAGVAFGVIAAVKHDRWADHLIQTVTMFLTSMPTFWTGLLLIMIFSVTLRWLPAIGSGSFRQLILPSLALGLLVSSQLTNMVRNSVIDVLEEPFVTTLRGKGLLERSVLYRHVLRNALIPVVTLFGVLLGELLSNSIVVETVFARQGLGRLMVEALGVKDIPMLMGVTLFASTFLILANLLVDLSYAWIDPRVRPA
jgi:peptide/nickel transport system permease protein